MKIVLPKLKDIPSAHVKNYEQIEEQVQKTIDTFDNLNEHALDMKPVALHHSQVDPDNPLNFFVVGDHLLKKSALTPEEYKQNKNKFFFDEKVIINPEILEMKETIEREVPERELADNEQGYEIVQKKKDIVNKGTNKEGCLSFPHRKEKNYERYYKIKVKYQTVGGLFGGLKTIKETVTGFKANIFQHEVDHANCKNIFHG